MEAHIGSYMHELNVVLFAELLGVFHVGKGFNVLITGVCHHDD